MSGQPAVDSHMLDPIAFGRPVAHLSALGPRELNYRYFLVAHSLVIVKGVVALQADLATVPGQLFPRPRCTMYN